MSSHHFVREGQEPALLIDSVDPDHFEILEQLAGWNPVIIAMDRAMPQLLLRGIQVDHLLAYSSEISAWEEIHRQNMTVHPCNENNWMETVSEILKEASCQHIQLLTRIEDIQVWERLHTFLNLTVFSPSGKWIRAEESYHAWLPKGTILKVVEFSEYPDENILKTDADGIIAFDLKSPAWICQMS